MYNSPYPPPVEDTAPVPYPVSTDTNWLASPSQLCQDVDGNWMDCGAIAPTGTTVYDFRASSMDTNFTVGSVLFVLALAMLYYRLRRWKKQ